MNRNGVWMAAAAVLSIVALGSCSAVNKGGTSGNVTNAKADLAPTQGNSVHGTVRFTQQADGVRVEADLTGLTPGTHGIHIHENGDCSSPDGSSAGAHYNPTNMQHGGPDASWEIWGTSSPTRPVPPITITSSAS